MSVRRECMREQVKRVLLNRILDGTYQPGERLVELQIAREMNTSQGPVREALRELEGLRIVESQTYRGTRVRGVSAREMREAYQVRAVLEELAAQLAISQIGANLEPLIAEVEAMVAAGRLHDLDRFAEHDAAFHRLIVEASGNSVLLQVWDSLAFEARTRINLLWATVSLEELAQLHQPIINALIRGDGKTAGQLLREHFEAAQPPDIGVPTEPDAIAKIPHMAGLEKYTHLPEQ